MIGVFDSGAGGLSILGACMQKLPREKFIYFSDSAWCPYGSHGREYIVERARFITNTLLEAGAKIIVVACNTATTAAIQTLRSEFDIPFVGLEPAVKPAALNSKTGVIGVLATAFTLSSEKYRRTRDAACRLNPSRPVKVVEMVGEGFVEAVEEGRLDGEEVEEMVRKAISPMINAGADNIVLGCTHYPFLMPVMSRLAPNVTIVDPAPAIASHLEQLCLEKGLLQNDAALPRDVILRTSGDIKALKKMYEMMLEKK